MIYEIGDIVKLDNLNHCGKIGIILESKYDNSFIYIEPYYIYKVLIQGTTEAQWISEETIKGKLDEI